MRPTCILAVPARPAAGAAPAAVIAGPAAAAWPLPARQPVRLPLRLNEALHCSRPCGLPAAQVSHDVYVLVEADAPLQV